MTRPVSATQAASGTVVAASPAYRPFGALRLVLAVMVVVSHTLALNPDWRGGFLHSVGIGNAAVLGFFVLSGFIVSEAAATFYRGRPGAFIANRFLRLFPPYAAAIALSLAVHAALAAAGRLVLPDFEAVPPGILSLPNILVNVTAILPIFNFNAILGRGPWYYALRFTWAIFVEFVFYYGVFAALAASAVTVALARCRGAGRPDDDRLAWWTWLAIAGIGLLWAIDALVRPLHHVVQFTPYFLLGLALWRATDAPGALNRGLAGLVAAVAILHCASYATGNPLGPVGLRATLAQPVSLVAAALFGLVCVAIAMLASRPVDPRWRDRDRALGDLSYPLYLNHYVLIIVSASLLPIGGGWGQAALVAVAVGLAAAMHRLVEVPMVGLRNRMRGRPL